MENIIGRINASKVGFIYEPYVVRVDFKDFYVTIDSHKNINCFSLGTFNGCPLPISEEQKQKIIEMIENRVIEIENALQDKADNLLIEF